MQILTNDEEFVVKKCIEYSNGEAMKSIYATDLMKIIGEKFSLSELTLILDGLNKKGFFCDDTPEHDYEILVPNERFFTLTHTSIRYRELKAKEKWHCILYSFIIPVFVSLITSLITTYFTVSGK